MMGTKYIVKFDYRMFAFDDGAEALSFAETITKHYICREYDKREEKCPEVSIVVEQENIKNADVDIDCEFD